MADDDDGGYELDPVSAREIKLIEQQAQYMELRHNGIGELNAAFEVGWSPAELRRHMKDKEFALAVGESLERLNEDMEKSLHDLAKGVRVSDGEGGVAYETMPHFPALQWWLISRSRGKWQDVKRIESNTTITITATLKEEARDTVLNELRRGAIAELQAPIIEAEVIEDGEDG